MAEQRRRFKMQTISENQYIRDSVLLDIHGDINYN